MTDNGPYIYQIISRIILEVIVIAYRDKKRRCWRCQFYYRGWAMEMEQRKKHV